MTTVTTARILADKACQRQCGQECVDWAVSMLEQGCDGHCIMMLAGLTPPFNHFEVARFRDRALQEIGAADITSPTSADAVVADMFRHELANEAELAAALEVAKDLYVAFDLPHSLRDFYLLHLAWDELKEHEEQFYWDGANRENVVSIVRAQASAFLQSTGQTG